MLKARVEVSGGKRRKSNTRNTKSRATNVARSRTPDLQFEPYFSHVSILFVS